MSQIRQIKSWFEKAVPAPSNKNIHSALGVHLEEIGEMFDALTDAGSTFPDREQLGFCNAVLDYTQRQVKAYPTGITINVDELNYVEMLDALADQIVTAIGVAHMLGMDIEGALQEVADSNDSKFGSDGEPIFNDQMKIMKGPNYTAPQLGKFTGRCQNGTE